jgi:hypothetical protein
VRINRLSAISKFISLQAHQDVRYEGSILLRFLDEAMADLKAIKRVGSTDEIKILAQLDSPRYGSAYRFLIQDERTMFEEDIKAELPEINNGDPKELNDFIRWGMREVSDISRRKTKSHGLLRKSIGAPSRGAE